MSLITFGELRFGAQKSQHQEIALEKLEQLMRYIPVIMPTHETAEKYAIIRVLLERNGLLAVGKQADAKINTDFKALREDWDNASTAK
jgi:predicted nucleic acid-binding protein